MGGMWNQLNYLFIYRSFSEIIKNKKKLLKWCSSKSTGCKCSFYIEQIYEIVLFRRISKAVNVRKSETGL